MYHTYIRSSKELIHLSLIIWLTIQIEYMGIQIADYHKECYTIVILDIMVQLLVRGFYKSEILTKIWNLIMIFILVYIYIVNVNIFYVVTNTIVIINYIASDLE
jgi:hypothetical protein